MKKRLLCLMLLCSMVLSMLSVPVLAEDAESEAFVCICDTACTESSRNPDCPVCGTPGAHLHDCALYEDAHEPEVEDEEPFEEEEPEEEEEPSEEDPTEEPENPEQPQDESENEGEDGEPEDEEGLDNAVDTLELTGEDMIRVYSGAVLSSSGTDPRSGVVFTLTANSYTCSRGHAGDVTKIRITDVDTRSWDEDKSVTIRFGIYVRCYVSDCYYNKDNMGKPDATITVKKEDSCHNPFNNEVTLSSNGTTRLTLTSDRSIAHKKLYPQKPATCMTDGNDAYWMCGDPGPRNSCGKIFSDAACTQEISEPKVCPALGHDFSSPNAHHEAKAATCSNRGNVEYWECSRCELYYNDDQGTEELLGVNTPIDGSNHEQEPTYTVYDNWHVAKYLCCNKTDSYEAHIFDSEGVCNKCEYEAPFRVWGNGDNYYGSFYAANNALKEEGA